VKIQLSKFSTILATSSISLYAFASKVMAQAPEVKNIAPVPIIESGNLMDVLGNIVNVVLIVIGILAVFYLVYGGVMYVTSGGDSEKASKGRTAITNAIIGIVIIMVSLLLYNYVIKDSGIAK